MKQHIRRAQRAAILAGIAILSSLIGLIGLIGISLAPTSAHAHPLAPALLELKEDTTGRVEILWKRSSLSAPGSKIAPIVPESCLPIGDPLLRHQGVALLTRWSIHCGEQGLVGREIRIDGLGQSGIDALVRITLADGRQIQRVLRRSEPSMIIPAKASQSAVFVDYMKIGFEHILSGADHLLFVFGLFMLCTTNRALVQTISAFTIGHSVTLSLAALGYATLPSGPIEVLIAASVLALAVELARQDPEASLMRRFPWPMAMAFGLLHGMGFAGALREVGLPGGEIPMALLSFNIGIELGQLAFVFALLALTPFTRRLPRELATRAAIYVMGSFAAYWVIQRIVTLL